MNERRPRRAVVLAAGYGTRLLPLTRRIPKALLPLWGVPMLEHALRLLRSWGVREVLVNGHHHADQIWDHLRTRPHDGLAVSFSYEPEILGTGGVLKRAAWFLDEAPCWMLNADAAADLAPPPFFRCGLDDETIALLWLHATQGPRTVEMREGVIRSFRSERPGTPGTYTFCGLHYFDMRILQFIEGDGFSSIISAYEQAMQNGMRVGGLSPRNVYWADIGTPEQFLEAHREVKQAAQHGSRGAALYQEARAARPLCKTGARFSGFLSAGPDVVAAPGASAHNAVLLEGVVLEAGGEARNVVVAPNTRVEGRIERLAMTAKESLLPGECAMLRSVGWRPEKTVASFGVPRGSARQFVRLRSGDRRAMLVRYDRARPENESYVPHARLLRSIGLRVPRVLADEPELSISLLEDLGDSDLSQALRRASAVEKQRLYREVLEQVVLLHRKGARAAAGVRLMPPFTPRLYRWEREWFAEHFLRARISEAETNIAAALEELRQMEKVLLRQPKVLLHRDLQSTNIFLTPKGPAFIDFQGMRLGPAAYDLASLLCDPYASLSLSLIESLRGTYAELWPEGAVEAPVFWAGAAQRMAQALGAYARLSQLPGNEGFARHIGPALHMFRRALARTGHAFPVLSEILERTQPKK